MPNSMTVDELRTLLSDIGITTSGTKPTLVKRLQEALREDPNESIAKKLSEFRLRARKKRGRGGGDVEVEKVDEIEKVHDEISLNDKFQGMSIQKLRKEASLRGVSTSGTKKELVQRLVDACAADDATDKGEMEEKKQNEKVVEEVKEEKLVKATKKGSAVLDQWLPDHIKSNYHVLEMGDGIYDAMLNQTNVGDNNNKFYLIQVLEVDSGGMYMVYNRWGRVGVKGQDKLFGPYSCRETAVQEFEQKFLAKTKNHWSNRKDFVSHPKSYTWLEMDYEEDKQDKKKPSSLTNIQPRESKLDPSVAQFISLICNISMMRQQMMEIGYNAEKLPLGKLSKSTILKGYAALKRIADVIGQSDRKLLEQLSGEFYTAIPHDFGFRKMRDFVIDTPQKLKSKLEMVEALGEIELATKLLSDDDGGMQDDVLYAQYERLHCELIPVEAGSEEFCMIQKYMKNTHGKTHSHYSAQIVQIFRVSKEGENERFKKFANTRNRMLLWHGSRLTNWTGILSQGLRIAPPEAPVTGYMFGKGVYFADMFSKSANYCCSSKSSPSGVLLLSEVALGEMEELRDANYEADKLPAGKLSTKGVGSTGPNLSESKVLDDGVVVPFGEPVQSDKKGYRLLYNEYIVYNVEQIRMRYVIQVKFKY